MTRIFTGAGLACAACIGFGLSGWLPGSASAADALKIENLMRTELQVAEGVEVIVSVIEIGPDFTLPKHYHPGEEFVYLLEGSATVWQQDKADVVLNAGDVFKIPLEQVHTAMTSDSSARAVIFRVHKKGAPDRIPVE